MLCWFSCEDKVLSFLFEYKVWLLYTYIYMLIQLSIYVLIQVQRDLDVFQVLVPYRIWALFICVAFMLKNLRFLFLFNLGF